MTSAKLRQHSLFQPHFLRCWRVEKHFWCENKAVIPMVIQVRVSISVQLFQILSSSAAILVQNTLSTKTKFSMSATYDIRKGLTKVFVHGSDAEEISAMVAEVGRNLRSIALPTLTITLFLNQRVGSAVEKIKDSHTTLSEVQNHIGVKTIWHPGKECCKGRDAPGDIRERLRTIDFNETSNKLTSILSRMAYCEFVGNVHLPMVNELEEINKQIVKSPTGSHETVKVAKRNLRGDNEFLKSSFTGVITRSRYLSKRASALQQTVSGWTRRGPVQTNRSATYRSSASYLRERTF